MKRTISMVARAVVATLAMGGCATAPTPMSRIEPMLRISGEAGPAAWYQLGRYYQGQNRYARAELAFRRALALDGGNAEAHNALAATLAAQGRLDEALASFQAAVQANPKAAHLHANLGRAYWLMGRRDQAVAELRTALAQDPGNRNAREVLARAEAGVDGANGAMGPGAGPEAPPPPPAPVARAAADLAPPAPVVSAAVAATPTVQGSQGITVVEEVPVGDRRAAVQVVSNTGPAAVLVPAQAPADGSPVLTVEEPPVLASATPRRVDTGWVTAATLSGAVAPSASVAPPTAPAGSVPARFRLEVANGNGTTGLARQVGRSLAAAGFPKGRLTNQKPYTQPATQIQYREGFADQARALGERFPQSPDVVARSGLDARVDVRIVLGHDLPRTVALTDPPAASRPALASAAAGE